MVQFNNNNYTSYPKAVRFGEQAYTMPASVYNAKYMQATNNPTQLPDIYNVDDSEKPSFRESLAESPAGMMFKPWIEHPLITFGTFVGLGIGMDWFAKKCGGEYEKSLVGKIANFGDKIHNSSFAQSTAMQKTGSFLSNIGSKVKNFLGKSDALKAANDMSIQPESAGARGLLYTTEDEIVQEFSHHIVSGKEGLGLDVEGFKNPIKLKNLYIDKDVEDFIKDTYKKSYKEIKNTAEAEKVANHILLKRLGVNESEIASIINDAEGTLKTKKKVLEIMGKDLGEPLTPELLKKIEQNPKEYKAIVRKIAENTKGNIWCAAGDYEWMGPFKWFFKRKISMDGVYNKFKSVAKDSGHTSTGRFLSKAVQTMYRGLTFGNGKLGAFVFIAPMLVEMGINTKKADKDKKIGTAVWGFTNAISWPLTFILGGKLLYGAASMKNAGISKENLAKIDEEIAAFNKTNEDRGFDSFSKYWKERKACKNRIKELRKVDGKMSVFDRILKKVSGILSYDLKKFNGYRTNSKITTALNKIPVGIRGKSGLVLKFSLFMFAIQPLIDGVMHKCCNAIFGKDYDASIEDEQKEAKKAQKQYTKDDLHKRLLEMQEQKVNIKSTDTATELVNNNTENNVNIETEHTTETQDTTLPTVPVTENEPINNIETKPQEIQANDNYTYIPSSDNQYKNLKQPIENSDNYTYVPSSDNQYKNLKQPIENSDNYTYIPSSDNVIKSETSNNENKYIPSQTPGNFNKTFDNSGLNSALKRADRAEQRALQILAGNFDNMH